MINTPQIFITAGTCVDTGLIARQYAEVAGNIKGTTTTAPEPPEIDPINLLSETLDSRVSYIGPAHTFISQNGNFLTSAENEWPLEYQNGIAIGRHEPEPSATNYQRDSSFSSLSETQLGQNTVWITSQSAGVSVNEPEDGSLFSISIEKPGWTHTGVYSEVAGGFIADDVDRPISDNWSVDIRPFQNASESLIRWYIARLDSTNYVYGRSPALAIGNYVASIWRINTTDNQQARAAQIELGTIPTSPIFNDASSQNTRTESTVIVTNPGSATGITIIYTDGTTSTVSFGTAQSVNIPVSTQAWATRYISEITYNT